MLEVPSTTTDSTVAPRSGVLHERDRGGAHDVRWLLRARWEALHPGCTMTFKQLDGLERQVRYLAAVARKEGDTFERTIRQMCIGLGIAFDGTMRNARRRHRGTIAYRLGTLIELGFVESWKAQYEANGEGRDILVVLPAGVAQSVRAAES